MTTDLSSMRSLICASAGGPCQVCTACLALWHLGTNTPPMGAAQCRGEGTTSRRPPPMRHGLSRPCSNPESREALVRSHVLIRQNKALLPQR